MWILIWYEIPEVKGIVKELNLHTSHDIYLCVCAFRKLMVAIQTSTVWFVANHFPIWN